MSLAGINDTFAFLALIANAAALAMVLGWIITRRSEASRAGWLDFRSRFSTPAFAFAWIVAAVCMLGSLFLQFGEHLTPCDFCWFQRIAMYPQAFILGFAFFLRDRTFIKWYSLPLAILGGAISIIHINLTSIQHALHITSFPGCSLLVPCSVQPLTVWGFITIPYMALSGFLVIITYVLFSREEESE